MVFETSKNCFCWALMSAIMWSMVGKINSKIFTTTRKHFYNGGGGLRCYGGTKSFGRVGHAQILVGFWIWRFESISRKGSTSWGVSRSLRPIVETKILKGSPAAGNPELRKRGKPSGANDSKNLTDRRSRQHRTSTSIPGWRVLCVRFFRRSFREEF